MKDKIQKLLENIENISLKSPFHQKVTLVAVSKTFGIDKIIEAYNCGLRIFGENKVQEAISKMQQLKDFKDINWHLIGHLQSNKVKKTKSFKLIHSIDSINLIEEISKFDYSERPDILIQINSSGEKSKFGLKLNEVELFFNQIMENNLHNKVNIRGLMAIGPLTEDRMLIRKAFKNTRKIYEQLQIRFNIKFDILSMGMSQDYDIAIEEGSNMVRIGSLIFGERNYG